MNVLDRNFLGVIFTYEITFSGKYEFNLITCILVSRKILNVVMWNIQDFFMVHKTKPKFYSDFKFIALTRPLFKRSNLIVKTLKSILMNWYKFNGPNWRVWTGNRNCVIFSSSRIRGAGRYWLIWVCTNKTVVYAFDDTISQLGVRCYSAMT